MSNKRVFSVGNRRDYPRELWGPADYEAERLEWARLEAPLTHAPGGPPPPVKFSLFPTPVIGGVRSKAVDELIAKHIGARPRRRGVDRLLDGPSIESKRRTDEPQERQPENPGVDRRLLVRNLGGVIGVR